MLRNKTETRPGLVALYNIRPGNEAGPFLHPGARTGREGREEGRRGSRASRELGWILNAHNSETVMVHFSD